MGVDLCGRDAGVPEHFLDLPQVGAAGQQVRGEAVPQRVRAGLALDAATPGLAPHESPDRRPLDRPTVATEKEWQGSARLTGQRDLDPTQLFTSTAHF